MPEVSRTGTARAALRGARRALPPPRDRAGAAADQFHDVIQLHIDHVNKLALLALADADHSIARLELAVLIGRATGNELVNDRVTIAHFELGTDPLNPDSDGDGLDDGAEVFGDAQTDPLMADSSTRSRKRT